MNAIGSDDIVYVTPPNNKETERTRVIQGDVLLTITGSKIGRVCSVPQDFEEAYISQHVAIIRTKGINPVYLSFYLSMPACGQRIITKQQYGQAKPGLNLTQIQNFEIITPDIDLQNQFAAIVEKVEGLKSRYQQSLTDLETLYAALTQKAFKGELDLSRIPLPTEPDASRKEPAETEPDIALPESEKPFHFSSPTKSHTSNLSCFEKQKPMLLK
nr:restriction endonuclease subunit S [Desulfobotulus pelophilus]